MSRNDPTPTSAEAAARRSRRAARDPMHVGASTPWEDRGERGLFNAFFANTFLCLRAPARLLNSIRRPETTSDALAYIIGCGLVCSLAWAINSIAYVYHFHDPKQKPGDVINQLFIIGTIVQFVIAPAALWAMVKVASLIYFQMASGETTGRLPPAVIFNVFSYSLAPCVVALIPLVGPPLALLWIVGILMVAGRSRLRLSLASSIVDALLSVLGAVIPAIGAYFALWALWKLWMS